MSDAAMSERWLPIPGYEGSYEVSDLGRVRSLDREVVTRDGRSWFMRGRIRNASPAGKKRSYLTVGLPDLSGRKKNRSHTVHSLVALAFLGPLPEGQEVRHLDGDSFNCKLTNLAHGTGLENEADKRRHGTHHNTLRGACRYGHLLVAPNLVASVLPNRSCLACSRARPTVWQAAKRGVVISHQELSDKKYRAIMG